MVTPCSQVFWLIFQFVNLEKLLCWKVWPSAPYNRKNTVVASSEEKVADFSKQCRRCISSAIGAYWNPRSASLILKCCQMHMHHVQLYFTIPALVVQTLDSTIHQINHCPEDSTRKTNCVIHWLDFYPLDSIIQCLNNRDLAFGLCWVVKWELTCAAFLFQNCGDSVYSTNPQT